MKIDKQTHIETGKQIKIVLAMFFDPQFKPFPHTEKLIPGAICTIVAHPSRKSRKNGDMGVWVEGTDEEKVFVRMFGWIPYFAPKPMQRTKQNFTRNKFPTCNVLNKGVLK